MKRDDGATKRFGKPFSQQNYPVVTCIKVREGSKRIVKIKEGQEHLTADAHVFIIGNTFITSAY